MLIKNYKRTKFPFGCNLFNDESNYHYWEDKKVTSDEIHILDYIKKFTWIILNLNIYSIDKMDNYRINNLMDRAKLDVIVLFSAENIFYLTQSPTVLRLKDFQQTRPNSSRLVIAIKEKTNNDTILLVPEFDYKVNKKSD